MASKSSAGRLLQIRSRACLRLQSPRTAAKPFSTALFTTQKYGYKPATPRLPRQARAWSVASPHPAPQQHRSISMPAEPSESKIYTFDDILSILAHPTTPTLLLDVREPHEHAANSIPTALNLPIVSAPDALLLPPDEFMDRFGWPKPPLNKPLVLFCKAGVRSRAAAGIARQAGYTDVGEYPGSWLDWEKRGGPGTKEPPSPGGEGEPRPGI